jgi:hypothetical protein
MSPAAAPALERLKGYVERNERNVAVAFFATGFVFDIVTVGRIDSWLTIGQQLVYLGAITAVLLHMLLEQGMPAPVTEGLGRLRRWYYEYRSAAIHFALGALMNLYAIFFFKSSSLLVSFGFLAFLIVLLVANESRRFKSLGLHFKFALLALCYLSFAAIVVPVAVGSIGMGVFLASMAVGALPLAGAAEWIRRGRPAAFALARRQILLPLGAVLVAFLASYLFRVIPPVPLSIPYIGVYHSVERTPEGDYRLGHERPWWRFWHHGDQWFRAQPGDRVFVFFRVFSPARFADRVQMRWYWEPGGRGWLLQDTIPIDIVGGRREGFRGYGFKANYQPGRWKVEVGTMDNREIGRVYFSLESVSTGPRELRVDVE